MIVGGVLSMNAAAGEPEGWSRVSVSEMSEPWRTDVSEPCGFRRRTA
jgi:hypothetical protein